MNNFSEFVKVNYIFLSAVTPLKTLIQHRKFRHVLAVRGVEPPRFLNTCSPLRQKKLFFEYYFNLQRSKMKINYISYKTTYPNIYISLLVLSLGDSQYSPGFLKYLPKNMAFLIQELWRKKNSNPSLAISRRKKVPMTTNPGGGVKSLVV